MATKKKANTGINVLEVKFEDLEQHDYAWDSDLMEIKEKQYAECIGRFLIWFSNLEHVLDIEIANLISSHSHDEGYVVTKELEMRQKIEIFYNLALPRVLYSEKRRDKKIERLNFIKKQLENLSELRNKVAHAKWNTLDKDKFIRVDTKTNKVNGFIKFRKFKITPAIIRRGTRDVESLTDKLFGFTDYIWE